jgi:cytochrome c
MILASHYRYRRSKRLVSNFFSAFFSSLLERDKEGPRLRGVYGRVAGLVDTFEYSEALKKSKITWTDETLEQWLTDTEKLVPGNDMTFHVEKAAERAEIIAYLRENSGK